MKRKIYQQLLDWKEKRNGEVALLVEGARRIGKSYIVEEFAKNEYESYILIDFNKAPQMVRDWFDLYLEDLDTLFLYLSQHYKVRLHERKSLIIFDEVQELRRAGTEKYSAASLLAENCERVFGLSGTPIYNQGGEIWNVINVLDDTPVYTSVP